MSTAPAELMPCRYLFNQDAAVVFPKQNSAFVNQSLTTLMNIIDHLVRTCPKALFIFDPTAFNNQCHLYALIVAQAVNQAHVLNAVATVLPSGENAIRAVQEYTTCVDRRFLYHAFFLSYAFLTDPKLIDKLACKALIGMQKPAPSQEFRLFLKDPGSLRTHAARGALNRLFADHMKKVVSTGEGTLYPELRQIAQADLQLAPSSGKGTLYTFPKFAGVAYLIDALSQERIPLLFKVKVVAKEGNGSFTHSSQDLAALHPGTPVVVFEMVVTGDSLSYVECRDLAKKCPSHSRRNVSSKDRHAPDAPCLFCSPKKTEVAPYQQKFSPVLAQANDMFLALGADFVLQHQKPFLPFFSDRSKFPELTALFESSVPNIQRYFLSMTKPLNMSVSHVYTDCAASAASKTLVIDASYETHLQTRELV